ncbi:uncharacterized protein [Typha latifolia]|uniref:uncharacterized protein isoform X2 n=1 Tax=Typha latifolia TaxID=4733 RepID=UPI003C30C223
MTLLSPWPATIRPTRALKRVSTAQGRRCEASGEGALVTQSRRLTQFTNKAVGTSFRSSPFAVFNYVVLEIYWTTDNEGIFELFHAHDKASWDLRKAPENEKDEIIKKFLRVARYAIGPFHIIFVPINELYPGYLTQVEVLDKYGRPQETYIWDLRKLGLEDGF